MSCYDDKISLGLEKDLKYDHGIRGSAHWKTSHMRVLKTLHTKKIVKVKQKLTPPPDPDSRPT